MLGCSERPPSLASSAAERARPRAIGDAQVSFRALVQAPVPRCWGWRRERGANARSLSLERNKNKLGAHYRLRRGGKLQCSPLLFKHRRFARDARPLRGQRQQLQHQLARGRRQERARSSSAPWRLRGRKVSAFSTGIVGGSIRRRRRRLHSRPTPEAGSPASPPPPPRPRLPPPLILLLPLLLLDLPGMIKGTRGRRTRMRENRMRKQQQQQLLLPLQLLFSAASPLSPRCPRAAPSCSPPPPRSPAPSGRFC